MRVVSVFPLDEFRLALKKVYGAAAPKGPFTALSQATLFFSRNSCRYVYAPSLRCRPDAPLTERLGILRELRAQFALDGGRVEQLTECKLDGRFRPANVRRRYVTADLNRPVVVHLRAA